MSVPEVQVFDLRGEPLQLAPSKWTPHHTRDRAAQRGVVLHQWAARVGTRGVDRLAMGEPLALARRGLAAPYGVSYGVTRAGVPVVAVCHPLERYTYASDAGNAHYVAVSAMGLYPYLAADHDPRHHSEVTEALAAACARALEVAVAIIEGAQDLADACIPDRPLALITHRQCANGAADHFACPGEQVVEMALRSPAVASGILAPDSDLVILPKYGRPWSEAWRRHLQVVQGTNPPKPVGLQGVDVGPLVTAVEAPQLGNP